MWCLNIILGDYGSVWPDVWPQNNCMSLWPIFHGPPILPYISKTTWWMSVMFLGNETVWHKLWPQNKYRSTWPIFHGLVILFNVFKIVWWVNIIVCKLDQCDTKIDIIELCRSVTYILGSSDFAPFLEDYLMEKCFTLDNGSVWHKDWPLKIYLKRPRGRAVSAPDFGSRGRGFESHWRRDSSRT